MYKNIYPDDVKFSYIDEFLRCLQFNDATYDSAKRKIHKEIDEKIRSSLSRFYSFRKSANSVSERYLDVFLDRTYVSQPMVDRRLRMPRSGIRNNLNFSQLAIRFDDYKNGMFAAKAIYSRNSFWNLKRSRTISHTDVGIYYGYLIPQYDGAISSDVIYGTIHLQKQGVEGIGSVYPNTISSFSYHDDFGARLVTDWSPQILLPLKHTADTVATGLFPPPIDVNLEENDRYDSESFLKNGIMAMTPLPSDFGFIEEFIINLTNEYLIW